MTRILIADDKTENRQMLQSLLQLSGFSVFSVKDGAEALAEIRKSPPDLIITDLLMPNMDGFELCRICKQDEKIKDIPFIVYTATFNDAREEQLVMALGADCYLIKPVEPEMLLQKISQLLAQTGQTEIKPTRSPNTENLVQQHNAALLNKLHQKVGELESEIARRDVAEKMLRKKESLIRIAAKAGLMGGWSVDLTTRMVTWSDEVARIHEMPADYSPSIEEGISFYAPEWQTKISQVFNDCAQKGKAYDEELEIITRNGNKKWVRTIGEAICDETGKITFVQGAFQDISAKKMAESAHEALQQQLLAIQKLDSLGQFAGTIAHDFNNLLSIILGHTEFALNETTQGTTLQESIEEIKKAADKAAALTRQLLAFSRKQPIAPVNLDLNQAITGIESMLQRLLGKTITLETLLGENLGLILADPGQIDQIIINLAANARDAMPEGGKLIIETSCCNVDQNIISPASVIKPGRYIILKVSDTGCGMGEELIEHIFEPYFTTKEKGKGTGLGLPIVYGVVTQNKGYIRVSSLPEQGTCFEIFFPTVNQT